MNMARAGGELGDEDFGEGQTMIAWSVVFAHHVGGGASLVLGFVTRVARLPTR